MPPKRRATPKLPLHVLPILLSKIEKVGNRVVKENRNRKHLLHSQARSVALCVVQLSVSLHSRVVGMMHCSAKVLVDGTIVGVLM